MLALELIPSGGAMKAGAVPGGLIVLLNNFLGFLDQTEQRRNSVTNIFDTNAKGPSTKDVRQMGRGVVLKFRTFPDGGRGGGL